MRVGDEPIRHGRHVDQPVLVHAHIDECAERSDVGDDTLEDHAELEVGDLLDARGEGRGGEGRARIASRLLELAEDVGDRRHAEPLVGELRGLQRLQ